MSSMKRATRAVGNNEKIIFVLKFAFLTPYIIADSAKTTMIILSSPPLQLLAVQDEYFHMVQCLW